ncbi:DNA-binding transcriptional LysR family regulator [Antricoccus suffuscus]|uniref:DNA-binding transcriptional LysR family regulator n=1 Tax=Antricoccus suffuscus TaxID=1629062 RepID=A0A2T1A753_9ACTN|nr:LysR substrate-binding domain-containing protein [Antricoccus suffuscus]PRZ44420.1 DNA-binding transcriptional LysR family regulator [Antricoccus suffuscus]
MEFRHLVSFVMLADELHFGRAAKRLHVAQPSLTAQMQKLERFLGVQLLVRNAHEVKLTAAGMELKQQAETILAQVDRAVRLTKDAADGKSGSVAVGYNYLAGRKVLPDLLSRMNADLPDVSVSLWERRTGPQIAAVRAGSLDLAMTYGYPQAPEMQYRRLVSDIPIVGVIGHRHPWAARDEVSFAELAGQQCVLFARDQSPQMYDAIFAAARVHKIVLDVARTADDPGGTAQLVATLPMVGFASGPRADSYTAHGPSDPIAVRLVDPTPTLDLYAVWRKDNGNPALAALVDRLPEV